MLTIFLLLSVTTALAVPSSGTASSKVALELQAAFRTKPTANIFITLKDDTTSVLNRVRTTRFSTRTDRLNTLYTLLLEHAAHSQKNVKAYLSSLKTVEFEGLWINNQIYVKNAELSIVNHLASFEEVQSIDEEFFAQLIEPVESRNASIKEDEYEWGIVKIQAPEAWEEIGNNGGKNIRVAVLSTGVRWTHEALRDNFLGDYGWYDPSTREPLPTDKSGEGTHLTGIIAGGKGIGVAPGSTWMACRGCATSNSCSQFDLNRCGQFFACPSLSNGQNYNCSYAPHIISNGWKDGRGSTWFNPVLEAWAAAGIIPVFGIGNHGPDCDTANSPGDNERVIGVGSTTSTDDISSFSSVGPTFDGRRMKPDISAPGSEVLSACNEADDDYRYNSGTFKAASHVAGTIALLLTRNSEMSIDSVKQLLFGNTDTDLTFSGRVCEGIRDDVLPNHVFGSGRVNALKSVSAQTKLINYK